MIDEHQEERASLYALGLLEGTELTQFQAILAGQPELRSLVDQLVAAASNIAFMAPAMAPPTALKDRLMAQIATRPTPAEPPAGYVLPFRLSFWVPLAAAAGFALTAIWFGQLYLTTHTENALLQDQLFLADAALQSARNQLEAERLLANHQLHTSSQQVASLNQQMKEQGDLAQFKISTLASLLGNSPQAMAVAVWNPNTQEGVLSVEKLPALTPDKDYQLWVVDPQYPVPVDGGVFHVDPATGGAYVKFKADKPVKSIAKFAISLERKGGVPKAEGPMVLLSQ